MSEQPVPSLRASRAIRTWLVIVAAFVAAMVMVGGATRLTGSGLSIVEWRPVTGAIPPLSDEAWRAEFTKYQQIPQYQTVNRGMSLGEFKFIYWWEWGHRQLGRLVGVVFLLPFLYFLWRGAVPTNLRLRLWGIFLLGAIQGGIGWWMVASGLSDRVSVSQYRLAIHLTLAAIIFAAVLSTAIRLDPRPAIGVAWRVRIAALALVGLVLLQIYLGALVAGLHAGLIYNTWPLIDGSLVPDTGQLFFEQPAWRNFFDNTLLVQFNHRMVAYLLVAAAVVHAADVAMTVRRGPALTSAFAFCSLIVIQAALGILTLIYSVPLTLALAHQFAAIVVLAAAVVHAARLRGLAAAESGTAATQPA